MKRALERIRSTIHELYIVLATWQQQYSPRVKVAFALAIFCPLAIASTLFFQLGAPQMFGQTFCFPLDGCTGTSTTPTTNSILIGNSSGVYDVKTLTAGSNVTIDNSGGLVTISSTGGGGGSFPFSATTNYGQVVYATNTPTLWLQGGIFASSTSHFSTFDSTYGTTTFASSTALTATTLYAGTSFVFDAQTFDSLTDDATLDNNSGDLQVVDVTCTNCLTTTEVASADLATAATNVSDADFGDVTVSSGAWAVEDDSHAHTAGTISGLGTADISGLDISDDTNLAATWPVILTGDTLSFGGLSTSTAAVSGNLPYFSGVNTFANVATTTLAGTANQISISNSPKVIGASGAVLTLPNHVIFPSSYQAALGSTTNATTTNFTISNFLTFDGVSAGSWADFCETITGDAGLCDADDATAAGAADPFTFLTNYATITAATTTPIWGKMGLYASSTSYFENATTTNLTVSGMAHFQKTGTIARINADTGDDTLSIRSLSNSNIKFGVNNADEAILSASNFTPGANDGNALGSATVSWADLFLASTGVVNWGNGNVTLTHATGQITNSGLFITAGLISNAASSTVVGNFQLASSSMSTFMTPYYTLAFSYSSSTQGVGTTTKFLGPSPAGITYKTAQCEASNFLDVSFYDGTNRANYIKASSTIGTITFSTNNTFNDTESMRVDIGTSTSGLGSVNLSCRVKYTIN